MHFDFANYYQVILLNIPHKAFSFTSILISTMDSSFLSMWRLSNRKIDIRVICSMLCKNIS